MKIKKFDTTSLDDGVFIGNANNSFPNYLTTGSYSPKPSIATLSNAMDVGAPSNVRRIDALYDSDPKRIAHDVHSGSFSDQDCLQTIDYVYNKLQDYVRYMTINRTNYIVIIIRKIEACNH